MSFVPLRVRKDAPCGGEDAPSVREDALRTSLRANQVAHAFGRGAELVGDAQNQMAVAAAQTELFTRKGNILKQLNERVLGEQITMSIEN